MYLLSRVDPATFVLSAEGENLPFRPIRPEDFAIASLHHADGEPVLASPLTGPNASEQAPPAKTLTLVFFYLLVAGTLGMAAWALITLVG